MYLILYLLFDDPVAATPALGQQNFPQKETVVREQQAEFVSPDGTQVRQTVITTTTTLMQGI
jgi:hypothetical protein